ncbi:MAG TPA: SpoIID/LytB domain-containing protein [Chloroflexia bacterium]|nr:SpoIID/LytB domain-containing protein [Chloroflexia bacterium]
MHPFRDLRPQASIRFIIGLVIVANTLVPLLALAGRASISPHSAPSTSPAVERIAELANSASTVPAIEGWVRSATSGQAINGANVTLDGRTHAVADANGYFRFDKEQVQVGGAPSNQQIQVSVRGDGYAAWSLDGAMYYAGDTLRVYPRLQPGTDLTTNEGSDKAHYSAHFAGFNRVPGNMSQASLASVNAAPPATIRIYRTQTGVVEVVPFRDYLKHTLPNEWIPSWSPEALKAGAMAVKSYAWYWVARGGKQVALGADLKDNVEDQVYDPNVSYASTDAAVEATYNYSMLKNGAVFQAQYCAGAYDGDPLGDCPWPGPYMTQWGSSYYANQGKPWGWIVGFYYTGAVISPSPPGGGYSGPPPTAQPTQVVPPTSQPTPPPPVSYVVGQGSNQPDVFEEAYRRNGGAAVLGRPTGAVRWWMQYVSGSNVLAQPFSGAQGRGDTWLVLNTLDSNPQTAQRAFMLSGEIARAYSAHTPPGPEWVGAPTSDPYTASSVAGGLPSQGFTGGTLIWDGQNVAFVPSPTRFSDWKAEYFVGYQPTNPGVGPERDLSGKPALVTNALTPSFQWPGSLKVPQSMGVGDSAWSVQFTKEIKSAGESYDFTLAANSGARLWIDGMLAINGWNWTTGGSDRYNIDLAAGAHTVRVQYYHVDATKDANLDLTFAPRSVATPVPKPAMPRDGTVRMASLEAQISINLECYLP